MISRIIKVEVGDYQPKPRLKLISFTETLIILDITKTESNNFSSSLMANNTKRKK